MSAIAVIGVPTSAGAFAPGQEGAPAALRSAGLIEALRESGRQVVDRGDREVWRWRPDRDDRRAQNLGTVVEIVRETGARVAAAIEAGELPLVLGGDCTVGVGTVAGAAASIGRFGLLYLDLHADLNVADAVPEGALDWMGMAHMLGVEGARRELVEAGPRVPLLEPADVAIVGWGPEQATEFERGRLERLRAEGLEVVDVGTVAADPAGAAGRAAAALEARHGRFVLHCDVDLVDFNDTPLSENDGRGQGVPFEAFLAALRAALAAPGLAAITVTELNPDHTEDGAGAIEQLTRALAGGLAARE